MIKCDNSGIKNGIIVLIVIIFYNIDFYCICDHINAALVSISIKKHY